MKREELKRLYERARESGVVSSKKGFAEFIGVSPVTLSYALTGSNQTVNVGNIIERAKKKMSECGIDIAGMEIEQGEDELGENSNWCEIIAEKDKQISELICIITSITQQNQLLIERLTKL